MSSDPRPVLSLAAGRLARRRGLKPTGIDRFEQAYLRHFSDAPGWRLETLVPATGPAPLSAWRGFRSVDLATGRQGRPAARVRRAFVQVSHSDLDRPARFAGLPAAVRLFYLHDVIPIDWPEYCRDGEGARHQRRIETVRRLADLVMVNSRHTAERLAAVAGPSFPPVIVNPPGVEAAFTAAAGANEAAPQGADMPYVVALSSIEARKNVALLLALWQRLGEAAPRLVLVGADGGEAGGLVHEMTANPVLARLVQRRSGLDDPAVATLLAGARAVLAPSLAEGYGLSIAEALAVGTPVIASDLPSHREVGGTAPLYLDPLDGVGWLAAVEAVLGEPADAAAHRRAHLVATGMPRRWSEHFDVVEHHLAEAMDRAARGPIVKKPTSL